MDDTRLEQIEKSIEEIRISQDKVCAAILGDFSKNTPGILEESRNLRRDVDETKGKVAVHTVQINEVLEFKNETKKIVAGIAVIIPLVFEVCKFGLTALWAAINQ